MKAEQEEGPEARGKCEEAMTAVFQFRKKPIHVLDSMVFNFMEL